MFISWKEIKLDAIRLNRGALRVIQFLDPLGLPVRDEAASLHFGSTPESSRHEKLRQG